MAAQAYLVGGRSSCEICFFSWVMGNKFLSSNWVISISKDVKIIHTAFKSDVCSIGGIPWPLNRFILLVHLRRMTN